MLAQEKFKALPTDIILCSMPKTGTTWLKALTFAIVTRKVFFGDAPSSTTYSPSSPLLTSVPHDCVPFLELNMIHDDDRDPHKFPLLSTHLPYTSLPKSILEIAGCKIIYICRDPKDTFVSLWCFYLKQFIDASETKAKNFFETEFEQYCRGKTGYGPFWDHVLSFWKASLENPEKVLFLKYEDMKKDTLPHIRRLAEFVNQPFSEEEEKDGVPQKITELASFSSLRSLEVNKSGKYGIPGGMILDNSTFFRKGEIGDWKNHLTREMAERMDAITKQKFSGLHFF